MLPYRKAFEPNVSKFIIDDWSQFFNWNEKSNLEDYKQNFTSNIIEPYT